MRGGGQWPFGTFPKIHPFWKGKASLSVFVFIFVLLSWRCLWLLLPFTRYLKVSLSLFSTHQILKGVLRLRESLQHLQIVFHHLDAEGYFFAYDSWHVLWKGESIFHLPVVRLLLQAQKQFPVKLLQTRSLSNCHLLKSKEVFYLASDLLDCNGSSAQ